MHFREIPFLRLFAPLCAGIMVAEVFRNLVTASWLMMIVGLVVMTIRIGRNHYFSDILFGTALMAFLISAGYILHHSGKQRLSDLEQGSQLLMIRISEYPDRKNNSYSFRARMLMVIHGDKKSLPHGSVMVYFMSDTVPSGWQPGDRLLVKTTPQPVINNGNPCEFNYRRYLEGQGIKYICFFRSADIIDYHPADNLSVRERSQVVAHRMISTLKKAGLQGDELALVTALTIGDKDQLDRDHLTSFRRSGAMHIMAVSGLHVGMISLGLSLLLFFMRGRLRMIRAIIIMISLWAFAFITGMSSSVLRATMMFTFLQAGNLMHRPASGMNTLLASAFILTALHPAVVFEAGFQLSYLAVAFIIAFYGPLHRMIRLRNKIADYLWQITAVSLVAQAGTLALTVRLFNIFPLLFLLTNIMVIPITFAVLVLTFLLVLSSSIPHVSGSIALLLGKLADIALGLTGMISSLKHGVIENIGMTASETFFMTITIALLLTSLLRVKKITLKPFLIAASLFFLCGIMLHSGESRKDIVIVYNIKGREVRARQCGRRLFVTPVDGLVPPEVKKHASTRGLKIEIIEP